ncbi:MAG TPA: hypothetical protein VJZ94_03235, partial [Candidatus Paceibacterota bacterium]|nr:hypothetical protein [Candidatus Paceibacterota bacterium]
MRGPDQRKPVYRIRQAVKRLEQKGLVRFEKESSGWKIRLSDKGKVQDSVWAHPYDCAELIVFVRT